jgi:secretion/DNA translocation related TadE-like protein
MSGGREDGLATVTAVALCSLLGLTASLGVLLSAAVTAKHRAGAAADFAAIAAAQQAYDPVAACHAAQRIAAHNGAVIESCRIAGQTAEVHVRVDVTGPLARLGPARAVARAGPG